MDLFTAKSNPIKLAAVVLRRRAGCEDIVYRQELVPYSSGDYEVLLRQWPSQPYLDYLAVFSGPVAGTDPEHTLLSNCRVWSAKLAAESGHKKHGIKGLKAVFLSVIGTPNVFTAANRDYNLFLAYIVPTTSKGSDIVSCYPDNNQYPKFYSLQTILHGMYANTINIHPSTREILATLDNWLCNKHTLPYAIGQLFQLPPTALRVISNPIHQHTTTDVYEKFKREFEEEKVDRYIENPFFGSGIEYKDTVDLYIENKYFGMGVPNYELISMKHQESLVLESGIEWTELFPLHKFACEGNIDGVKQCIYRGCDPNKLDSDGWSCLHYACWYNQVDIVMYLLKEAMANINIQNESGSTPLHLAAGNGHKKAVECLLQFHDINTTITDDQERTPLDVCIENKSNKWKQTMKLLKSITSQNSQQREDTDHPVNRHSAIQFEEEDELENDIATDTGTLANEDLMHRGSLANVLSDIEESPTKVSTIRKVDIGFMDGQHHIVNFHKGKETTASEVLMEVCHVIHLVADFQYSMALWIISNSFALQLGNNDKPLMLLSKWSSLMMKLTARNDQLETPHIYLKRNVFLSAHKESSIPDPIAIKYLYYDALHNVLNGTYPTSEEEALELATISMQYGDFNPSVHTDKFIRDNLHSVAPAYKFRGKKRLIFEERLLKRYISQSQDDSLILYNKYLVKCRQWSYYGAMFFEGNVDIKINKLRESTVKPVHKVLMKVGINCLGFHLINKDKNILVHSYALRDVTWSVSKEKQTFIFETLDSNESITIQTKQYGILDSIAREMEKQL